MQFLRCKCGEQKCWTSMGHASCDVCEKCGSTLGYGPNSHPDPTAHDVLAEISDGKLVARCTKCFCERPIAEARNLDEMRTLISSLSDSLGTV